MESKGGPRWYQMLPMSLGALSATLDSVMLNVSLPAIIRDLGCDVGTGQFIVSSYTFTICSLLLIFGHLSIDLGRKRMFAVGIGVFSISCILASLSPNVAVLIMMRVIQGVGAAMFMANGMALVNTHFTNEFRGRAFGIMSTAMAVASIMGPSLGGFISSQWNWRWVFISLVPMALSAAVLAPKMLNKESGSRVALALKRIEYRGALLSTLVVMLLVSSLFFLKAENWFAFPVLAALTGLCGWLFVRQQRRSSNPILPSVLLDNRLFISSNVMSFLHYTVLIGLGTLLPLHLVSEMGRAGTTAGLLMSLMAIPILAMSYLAGYLADRHSAPTIVLGGTVGVVLGVTALMAGFYLNSVPVIGFAVVVFGIGVGFFNPSNNKVVMSSVEAKYAPMAGSMNVLFRNLGNGFGTAVTGILFGALLVNNSSIDISAGLGCLFLLLLLSTTLTAMAGVLAFMESRQKRDKGIRLAKAL